MPFDPQQSARAATRDYFVRRAERFPGLVALLDEFLADPTLGRASHLLRAYFRAHRVGDVEALRALTWTFADKRVVRAVVDSVLADEEALEAIAARSYPHPIGFDKLVLADDRAAGFKLRLHVYWRGANFASLERLHLHRFEMASAVVTGELTNHVWRVTAFRPSSDLLAAVDLAPADPLRAATRRTMPVYAGYRRDADGALRKTYLGEATIERGASETFTSGDAYAQPLEDAHFVETNAETGFANGDFCSTVYVHGPALLDRAGRALPVLFEDVRLPDDDATVPAIPALAVEQLRGCLVRYRDALTEILGFYDWLYDPKHGRNLSVGMIAGYLLCEAFRTPHAIDVFERRYDDCKGVLDRYEGVLSDVLDGRTDRLSDADRSTRYVRLLVAKARAHPDGPRAWLGEYGSLRKEMWRYFGALRGEVSPRITVLKPIWDGVVKRKLPGGMHYGHVGAMIEAAFEANAIAMRHFEAHSLGPRGGAGELVATFKDEHNIASAVDDEIEERVRRVLCAHYPAYRFCGEEHGDADDTAPVTGARRFLVDPLDGTRNFLGRRQEFGVSLACQEWTGTGWSTTDAVVSHPASGRIFWAERGQGAFVIERNDFEHRGAAFAAPVDAAEPLRNQIIDYSARGLDLCAQTEVFRELVVRNAAVRNSGSVALILAYMAGSGGAGAIITANDYDVAAGVLIAHEAGACVSQLVFKSGGEERTCTVAGAADRIHGALAALVREQIAKHGGEVLGETLVTPQT
ncbi:inositol monophosphatase family protein [Gemmata sp. JC717]|uniref:inositol monophosphatase family protein n=1 Tax=Gemmata algarum TaxID=2975278 RepID=UPI0021BB9EF9|nr:inositol monophosphatase family protein [Gemmata algarum]MDY3555669.1 inositol monophosphatase family protein [Gemmata algarum]